MQFSQIMLLINTWVYLILLSACSNTSDEPDNKVNPYSGVWLSTFIQEDPSEEPPIDILMVIDPENYVSMYDCQFLEFELFLTPRKLSQNKGFDLDPLYEGDDFVENRSVTLSLDSDELTATVEKSSNMPEISPNETSTIPFEKVSSIPSECVSDSIETELSSISQTTVTLGQTSLLTIEYRYRIVDPAPGAFHAQLSGIHLANPSTGFVVPPHTIENAALGTGDVVSGTFTLEIGSESLALAQEGDIIELSLGFYTEYEDGNSGNVSASFLYTGDATTQIRVIAGD